ncbi:hypothetical protein [Priestia aryabhattai]
MKKRVLNKKNKKRHILVLEPIKSFYKTKNEQYNTEEKSDVGGENTICYFEINSIQDWKFGIVLGEGNALTFFGEHKSLDRKFKAETAYITERVEKSGDVIQKVIPLLRELSSNSDKHFSLSYEVGKMPGIMKPNNSLKRGSDALKEENLEELSISGVTVNRKDNEGLKNGDQILIGNQKFYVHIEDGETTFK